MKNTVYIYVFDTIADWEIGYLSAEINSGRYFKKGAKPLKVVTVGITKTPIITMGGLKILPEIELKECSIKDAAALILPGGNTWTEAFHAPIIEMAEKYLEKGIVVGAICGATIGLAMGEYWINEIIQAMTWGILKWSVLVMMEKCIISRNV
ncbi:putative intracellular protease/amidase [Clostridium saccharoperbutylacetonicum]|nr:putative intracellular protease/amidase [Clostridium saccharoperbutylacetonicum]